MEEKVVDVVYPIIKNPTGNRSYAERILKGLNEAEFGHRELGIRKIEISLRGNPFGSIIYQYLGLKMKSLSLANSHSIHSLVPELTPKNEDIITLHDIPAFIQSAKFMTGSYYKKSYNLIYGNALNARMLISSTKFGKEELMRELKIEEERIAVVYESIDHLKFYPTEIILISMIEGFILLLSETSTRERDLVYFSK